MSITVDQFFTDITPQLHGTTVNKLPNKYEILRRAAVRMRSQVDPPTTIRRSRIDNAIYSLVYNYTAPTDLADEGAIVDIRPIKLERTAADTVAPTLIGEFDRKKWWKDLATIETINAVKTLRIAKQMDSTRFLLHGCDSTTIGGTVTAGGDASFTEIDYLDYVDGSASLVFALSGATGSASITFALSTAQDLSKLENLGALFEWLKFPDATRLNSVTLDWGSSSGVYWSKTVTAATDRAFETNAWMQLRHDWSSATETGSPTATDAAAIDYLKITISYDAGTSLSGMKLDSVTASLGEAWEILYYSDCFFRDTTGVTYKTLPTVGSDVILLDTDGIEILQLEYLRAAAQQSRGRNMRADADYATGLLGSVEKETGLYYAYSMKHPSQRDPRTETYFEFSPLSGDDD